MSADFQMYAGDDKTLAITVKDDDDDPVVITGASIKWRASRSHGKTASIIKATGGSGITITSGATGQFEVDIDAADTEDLKGSFYHEAEVTFANGTISTVLRGVMQIEPVLVRAT